jgi:ABC-2 type transport system ATP-binding protein
MAQAGTTILFATHYLEEADAAADRVVIIGRGHTLADGTADQIKRSIGQRRIRFTLENHGAPGGPSARLQRLDGVERVELYGARVTLQTRDTDATVRDLVQSGLAWRDLDVEAANLEQAFLTLTGAGR